MRQNNRVALVTGAAKRVGRAVAVRLAKAGYAVAVHFRTSAKEARGLVNEIRLRGGTAESFRADLAKVSEARRLAAAVERTIGPISLLVNSASAFESVPLLAVTERIWDKTLAVNLKSVFFLSLETARRMRKRRTGVIVNIEDVAVRRPYKNYAPYLVSKSGVAMLTKILAVELAPDIRVCGVAPGPVLLPERLGAAERETAVRRTLLKREGSPADVAAAVLFLAEEATYTTGSTLLVDGGRSIG